jgi:hypothetical protein
VDQASPSAVNQLHALIVRFDHVVNAPLIHRYVGRFAELGEALADPSYLSLDISCRCQEEKSAAAGVGHNDRIILQDSNASRVVGLNGRSADTR